MHRVDVTELVDRARSGQARAVGRLLSLVEDAHPQLAELAEAVVPYTGHARIIGLTGPPGVGKSTITSALVAALRSAGNRVGVVAVDPSSPFSGGALLGDRIRMSEHATDPGVFIRSMAARGHLGGLAWATPQAMRVLDAAGFDVVLVETVGVGQSEVDVVSLADTTAVLLAPGMGDGIQAVKAGVLEIADLFVVNKADADGADSLVRDLKQMISQARQELRGPSWRPHIVRSVATRGEGIDEIAASLDQHRQWLGESGELVRRRHRRASSEVEAIALERLRARLDDVAGGSALDAVSARVASREIDPYAAAEELIAGLTTPTRHDGSATPPA